MKRSYAARLFWHCIGLALVIWGISGVGWDWSIIAGLAGVIVLAKS